jgi:hypothetical protein
VIENGSQAGAFRLVEDLPARLNARYMHRERGNKSYALNQALDTITDGLVVFFDDDVRVHPDTIKAYAEAAAEYQGDKYFGGTVEVNREVEPPGWLEPSLPSSACGYKADGKRDAKWYVGFNWAAFLQDIRHVGGFDPQLGPGAPGRLGDEADLQRRLRAVGVSPVDVPNAITTHYVPEECMTLQWALSRKYQMGVSRYHQFKGCGHLHLFVNQVILKLLKTTAALGKNLILGRSDSVVRSISGMATALGTMDELRKNICSYE